MYTSIIMLITGLIGFIICVVISAFSEKLFRQMQAIAGIFGWVAITGICFAVTKNIFESFVMALLLAAVAALVVMALVTLLIWGELMVEKKIKAKCFK